MRAKLPVVLSLSDFFENPTVAQQARSSISGWPRSAATAADASRERQLTCERAAPQRLDERCPNRDRSCRAAEICPIHSARGNNGFGSSRRCCRGCRSTTSSRPCGWWENSTLIRWSGRSTWSSRATKLLRTTIQMAAERHIAIVHESWSLRMKRIDLSGLAPAQREAEVERLLIDEPRRPYDLETEPGIRATLVRLGPSEHVFILMMHHLICDRGSLGVLWRELSSHYRALSRGEQRLPRAASRSSTETMRSGSNNELTKGISLRIWPSGEETCAARPTCWGCRRIDPVRSVQSYRGARQRLRLSPTLAEACVTAADGKRPVCSSSFTAALNALLYRYTGSEDIPLGIPLGESGSGGIASGDRLSAPHPRSANQALRGHDVS